MRDIFAEEYEYLEQLQRQEAEEVCHILQKWYMAMRLDGYRSWFPDYNGPRVTLEQANRVVQAIDDYLAEELTMHWAHWAMKGKTDVPRFMELPEVYRIRLVQELVQVLKC